MRAGVCRRRPALRLKGSPSCRQVRRSTAQNLDLLRLGIDVSLGSGAMIDGAVAELTLRVHRAKITCKCMRARSVAISLRRAFI